jgi:hypothetical protein
MSLDCCIHLGRKLADQHTCVLRCDRFPECLARSPLSEALAIAAALAEDHQQREMSKAAPPRTPPRWG